VVVAAVAAGRDVIAASVATVIVDLEAAAVAGVVVHASWLSSPLPARFRRRDC
jgi:hypothetical protein